MWQRQCFILSRRKEKHKRNTITFYAPLIHLHPFDHSLYPPYIPLNIISHLWFVFWFTFSHYCHSSGASFHFISLRVDFFSICDSLKHKLWRPLHKMVSMRLWCLFQFLSFSHFYGARLRLNHTLRLKW